MALGPRYTEFGRYDGEWSDFNGIEIYGRSIIVDGDTSNSSFSGEDYPYRIYVGGDTANGRRKFLFEVQVQNTLRSRIGPSPVLFYAQLAMYRQGGVSAGTTRTCNVYRIFADAGVDITNHDVSYRYKDDTATETWYNDAYSPVPGQEIEETPYTTWAYYNSDGAGATVPDHWCDVLDPLSEALIANDAMRLLFVCATDTSTSTYIACYWDENGGYNYDAYRPHLQIFYFFPIEFHLATTSGDIDLSQHAGTSGPNRYYLGAVERGEAGVPVKGFVRNWSDTAWSHLEIWDNHPEWSPPYQTGGSGTGRMDYVELNRTPGTTLSQKYTVTFTTASAYWVKGEGYADYTTGLNSSSSDSDWQGSTSSDFTAVTGGLEIPAAVWQPGTLAGDTFEFYVLGDTTDGTWPADSQDMMYVTSDDSGSPDEDEWRLLKGQRTKLVASVTIDATTKLIPVRAIDTAEWEIGSRAFIADSTNINDGDVKSVQAASIGTPTQTVGTGLDDLSTSGNYYGTTRHLQSANTNYGVKITDAASSPEKFQWTDDGGSTWNGTDIDMTGSAQQLGDTDVYVTWAATTGHTLNDEWEWDVEPWAVELENLTSDSTVYSAGAYVGTTLPIRDLAVSVWGQTNAASGASEGQPDRIYMDGPVAQGFAISDTVHIQSLSDTSIYETATVTGTASTYLQVSASLSNDYEEESVVYRANSADQKPFWLKISAPGSTNEETKTVRLGIAK